MTLPDSVAIKFNLYTLACRELLNRLHDLHAATYTDPRLPYLDCLGRFDETLHRFFERSAASDMAQAAEQFGNQLRAEATFFSNTRAAAIFDDVVTAIHNGAATWHYQGDLERFHVQGRDLARRLFAGSPWPETQARLARECPLIVEYGAPDTGDRPATMEVPFGYRAAPLVYYPPSHGGEGQAQNRSGILLARFTFKHDFTLYLAYPFLILHEYTAHIYATDDGNERFNDGWMLHAAAAFLKRVWNKTPEQLELNWEQAGAFYERLYGTLNPIPRQACRFARDFDDWLSIHSPERFAHITFELASFSPRPGEKVYWPTQFINALEFEFRTDPQRLLRKLHDLSECRELMSALSPT